MVMTTQWVPGTIVAGHGVASGSEKQDQFPGGAIALQKPVFSGLGLDLARFYDGTINVDIAPHRIELRTPRATFEHVVWLDGYPAETFSFADGRIRVGEDEHTAMLFYPHPETKPEHFQPPTVIELLAPYIPGLRVGASAHVWLDPDQVAVR
jgi:hypothetical protein